MHERIKPTRNGTPNLRGEEHKEALSGPVVTQNQ